MSGRKIILANDEFYHIYNRGITRQPIFSSKRDYERFLLTLSFYRFTHPPLKLSRLLQLPTHQREMISEKLNKEGEELVEILAFSFMLNHFHLLLRQKVNNGISIFLSRSANSYTRYFNIKHKRKGDLFEGVFKAVRVETEEQLIHLSRYIHLNPVVSFVIKEKELASYPWSSLPDYLAGKSTILDLTPVLNHFKSKKTYQKFVFDQVDYGKKLEKIKHLLLED